MTDIDSGYLGSDYLSGAYAGGDYQDVWGMQVNMVIGDKLVAKGMQANQIISNKLAPKGMQANQIISKQQANGVQVSQVITDKLKACGMQVSSVIGNHPVKGMQANQIIAVQLANGMQVSLTEIDQLAKGMQVSRLLSSANIFGMSVKADSLRHVTRTVYLEGAYLEDAYLGDAMSAFMGMQVTVGVQNQPHPIGMQVYRHINTSTANGMQARLVINKDKKMGMQVQQIAALKTGMQITNVIYNATELRVMTSFPSRGIAALLGNNWTASTTASSDYAAKNLNTDIIEQAYRSGASTASLTTLICDTGVTQGVPIDTIALLGHNLTKSATVQVQGSNDNFATTPNIVFNMTTELENMYYISPAFPSLSGQNRYWKFIFQDSTNPSGYIEVGTLLFGTASIFSVAGLSFKNPIVNGYRHFKDELKTEGFTGVSNDRALKKFLKLEFEKLDYFKGNYRILDDSLKYARTSLKCLVIPTPQYPSRFAVFAKFVSMPEITHTAIDLETGYIDINIELDESL